MNETVNKTPLEILTEFDKGLIDLDTAAEMLDMAPARLERDLEKMGQDRTRVLGILGQIMRNELSRSRAQVLLGLSPREVNLLMSKWSVRRDIKEYAITRAASKIKWDVQNKAVADFIAGRLDIEKAADECGLSVRQMRRKVVDAVEGMGLVFRDIANISLSRRLRLSNEFLASKNLEDAKLKIAEAVAACQITAEEAALQRLEAKRLANTPPPVAPSLKRMPKIKLSYGTKPATKTRPRKSP